MKKIDIFKKKLKKGKIFIIDGATGTELQRRGLKTTLPLWSAQALLDNPESVKEVHLDYIKSGAEIITTNTFRTTKRTLAKVGKTEKASELTILACKLAQEAIKKSGKEVFVAGSVAPLEDCYLPELTPKNKELKKEHFEYISDLVEGGIDFVLIETMITLRESMAAIKATQKLHIPFAICFCCNDKGELLGGEKLIDVLPKINKYDPLFVGLNCMPSDSITKFLKKLKKATTKPLCVYAHGDGQPADGDGWEFRNEKTIDNYLNNATEWLKIGAQVVGGCCGTTPEYIEKLALKVKQNNYG